jgi:hypothetical protein
MAIRADILGKKATIIKPGHPYCGCVVFVSCYCGENEVWVRLPDQSVEQLFRHDLKID